jgi:hypothetical protein
VTEDRVVHVVVNVFALMTLLDLKTCGLLGGLSFCVKASFIQK